MTAGDATTVIDMLNEVSNRFSVSSTDIASGMTKSSSALSTYGNTMSESISLITAGTEIMTGQASKVSKGLRSIGANIVKLADDTGVLEYSVNGVTKSLSLFDEQGKALSTFDVLSEVAKDWDNMSQAEQSNLALAQAG
jgi:TP901 family phage tail tape measure protein